MYYAKKSLPIDSINILSYFFFVKYFRRPKQKVGHPGVLRMDFPWRRGRISLPIGWNREESGGGQPS